MKKRWGLAAFVLGTVCLLGGWTAPYDRHSWDSPLDLAALAAFDRQEPGGLYRAGDYLVQAEPALEPAMAAHAGELFQRICEENLGESAGRTYLAVVPGKHAFLAGDRPALDWQELTRAVADCAPALTPVGLGTVLSAEDYYRTDAHWRQEALLPAAEYLCGVLGVPGASGSHETKTYPVPFAGDYLRDLPLAPDRLNYLTGPGMEEITVTRYDLMGRPHTGLLYDRLRAREGEGYNLFLSGAQGLLVLENPAAATERELILFRDSFGSSLAPLLAESYCRVTLVDLRYFPSYLLGETLDFHGQDVLFLYSTLLLNNSLALR